MEKLLQEFLDTLRSKGEMSAEEIVEWGEKRGIRLPFTLYIIVMEAKALEDVEASPEEVDVYPEYNIMLPKWLRYAARPEPRKAVEEGRGEERRQPANEEKGAEGAGGLLSFLGSQAKPQSRGAPKKPGKRPEKQGRRQAKAGGRRRRPAGGTLLAFIEEKAEAREAGKRITVEEEPVEEAPDAGEALSKVRDLLEDERYLKALRYLSHYWSVGLYRFYKDMERSGVENPREILKTLYSRGLVEIDELEVVNAKPELRALRQALRKSLSLADVFG